VPEWERELQAELQEYEVVDDGNNITDADLEQEIMKQIEAESQNTWTFNLPATPNILSSTVIILYTIIISVVTNSITW